MTPESNPDADNLFRRLRELPESEFNPALDAACAGNMQLRAQIMRLQEADRHTVVGERVERQLNEASTPALPPPGTVIGNYRLGTRIGAGGMGVVYQAQDLHLDRRVAVKILPLRSDVDAAEKVRRFQREARSASALNHPNIVSILDAGADQGFYYIAMEFVEGKTLRELAATPSAAQLDSKMTSDVVAQIASALGAAHEAGFVHRDIKPENIMMRSDGLVKVLDFGLAKLREGSQDDNGADNLTRPGTFAGTMRYLSPEQVMGKAAGPRSDLFSVGVVAYELVTGVHPFEGPTAGAVFDAILNRAPVAPSSLRPQLGADLDGVILTALEKDPELRFQTASELRSACKRLSRDSSVIRLPVAPLPHRAPAVTEPAARSFRPWGAVGTLFTVALLMALWAPWRTQDGSAASRPLIQLDLELAEEPAQFAISPDATQLALVTGNGLAIRRLDDTKVRLLEGTQGVSFPFFSPDGAWVGFFAGRKLQKVAVTGGAPVVLCDAPSGRGASWGDDGTIVASLSSSGGLYSISSTGAGAQPKVLAEVKDDGRGVSGYRWPQVLPKGKGILFTTNNAGGTVGSLHVLSADGSIKTLVDHCANGRYMGNHLVYSQRGRLFTVPIDLDHLRLTGPAEPLVDGVASDTLRGAIFESSLSGALVYRRAAPGTGTGILSWLDSTGRAEPIPAPPASYVSPSLSPDGSRLALAQADEAIHNLEIYDLSRRIMSRLTFDAEPQFLPVWTPDGQFVVFRSGSGVAWIRSDGSGKLERLSTPVSDALPSSFSPDGKWLVFAANRPGTGWDIWLAPATESAGALTMGTPQAYLTQAGGQYAAVVSPDGRWIAYSSDESGRGEVYVAPFSPQGPPRSGKWQVSKDGGIYPHWSRDGGSGAIFFRSSDRHVMVARYEARGDTFIPGPPSTWASQRLDVAAGLPSFDVGANGRVAGIFEARLPPPETHLRIMLNINDELARRERSRR